jgi:succinate-semialdehyde dehydrogenase/glutarate-semialdehyde dehydrogenase
MTELIIEAGVPAEAVQIVTGRGSSIGGALSSSPLVDIISLTGSTEAGIDIARNAAKHLRRVHLELGGNDAVIIFEDADLENAWRECINGRIFHGGQVCCGTKRFVVQKSILRKFIDGLIEKLERVKVGNPLEPDSDMGPLVSESAAATVEEQVGKCLAQGAECAYGGKRYDLTYFQPTVLAKVTAAMDIARDEEVFGPVFPVIGFDGEDEAVAIVNAAKYGLSGGVMTGDYPKAMRVAHGVNTGTMVINGCSVYRSHDMPFGGHKMSGMGTEGFLFTLEEMLQTKSIVMKNILAE